MKNIKIVVLTATYNHPSHLKRLYNSLVKQSFKDFTWVIVNDGSRNETEEMVKVMVNESLLNIDYIYQTNQGKSSAINKAFDVSGNNCFAVIIDDDEELFVDALQTVYDYVQKYLDTPIKCINFTRKERQGAPLTNVHEEPDRLLSLQKHKSLKMYDGGYVGYYLNKMEGLRFPLFNNEKYVGPSVLMMLACSDSPIVWSSRAIGTTEFLEGGITVQGRSLRLKNPKGMIKHASLMIHPDSSFKTKLAYSVLAYAYKYYSGISTKELNKEGLSMSIFYPVSLFGWCLSKKWKKQYGFVHY